MDILSGTIRLLENLGERGEDVGMQSVLNQIRNEKGINFNMTLRAEMGELNYEEHVLPKLPEINRRVAEIDRLSKEDTLFGHGINSLINEFYLGIMYPSISLTDQDIRGYRAPGQVMLDPQIAAQMYVLERLDADMEDVKKSLYLSDEDRATSWKSIVEGRPDDEELEQMYNPDPTQMRPETRRVILRMLAMHPGERAFYMNYILRTGQKFIIGMQTDHPFFGSFSKSCPQLFRRIKEVGWDIDGDPIERFMKNVIYKRAGKLAKSLNMRYSYNSSSRLSEPDQDDIEMVNDYSAADSLTK